jgi:hypothetical protein
MFKIITLTPAHIFCYMNMLILKLPDLVHSRVARWYIFRTKIPIWAYFRRPWNGKGWNSLHTYDHTEYFTPIVFILWLFGIFYGYLVYVLRSYIFIYFWYVLPNKIWQPCCAETGSSTLANFGARVAVTAYVGSQILFSNLFLTSAHHRNLRTGRIMHLCQNHGVNPADMARPPHLINTKK